MPTLGEIATSVLLGDGESAVVTWIPSSEVVVSEGTFGLQYSFALLDENGEPAALKGGSRLISAWKKAVAAAPKTAKQLSSFVGLLPWIFTGLGKSFASRHAARLEPSNAIGR